MKLLIYGLNYAPEITGVGKYTSEMAEYFARMGVEVEVVTAYPHYPSWKIQNGYNGHGYLNEVIEAVHVCRCPAILPCKISFAKRLIFLLSFAITSFPIILFKIAKKPDIILVVEPTSIVAPSGLILSCLFGCTSWLHVQDFEFEAAFSLGMLPFPRLSKAIFGTLDSFIRRSFDMVSTISKPMQDLLISKKVPTNKIFRIDNWVDTHAFKPINDCKYIRNMLRIPEGRFIALYSGSIGKKQGLEIIPEMARLLSSDPVDIVVCGDGAFSDQLKSRCDGLVNVHFIQFQPIERFNELLNSADIHLLPQLDSVDGLVMPSKLTGILAVGGVVVATVASSSFLADIIKKAGGLVVEPGNAQAIADAIRHITRNPAYKNRKSKMSREYCLKFMDKDIILLKAFHKIFKKTLPI